MPNMLPDGLENAEPRIAIARLLEEIRRLWLALEGGGDLGAAPDGTEVESGGPELPDPSTVPSLLNYGQGGIEWLAGYGSDGTSFLIPSTLPVLVGADLDPVPGVSVISTSVNLSVPSGGLLQVNGSGVSIDGQADTVQIAGGTGGLYIREAFSITRNASFAAEGEINGFDSMTFTTGGSCVLSFIQVDQVETLSLTRRAGGSLVITEVDSISGPGFLMQSTVIDPASIDIDGDLSCRDITCRHVDASGDIEAEGDITCGVFGTFRGENREGGITTTVSDVSTSSGSKDLRFVSGLLVEVI
jgi:hypothetical protein